MMVDLPRYSNLLLIICLFMATDIRNCSDNFSRTISSTPVGTTEIEIKSKSIGWNTDGTLSVAEIENRTDAIGWNTDGTVAVAEYNGCEQTTENTNKNIVNQNAYTITINTPSV